MGRSLYLAFSLVVLSFLAGCSLGGSQNPGAETSTTNPTPTPTPFVPSGAATPKFAFWYDRWSTQTPSDLRPADAVIGVAPFNVGRVHGLGKLALQYQSYYETMPGTQL